MILMYRMEGTTNSFIYLNIVKNILLPFAKEKFTTNQIYHVDNDPKHTVKIVKQFLNEKNIPVSKWLAQSPN